MPVLFVGSAIPEDMMEQLQQRDRYPQVAGHKLHWNIIRGLDRASKRPIDLVSGLPISRFPAHPKIWCGFGRWAHEVGAKDYLIPYINLPGLQHLTRFVSTFVLIMWWLLTERASEDRMVLVYSLYSPFLLSAVLARSLMGGTFFLIAPDMPQFMDVDLKRGGLARIGKRLDTSLSTALARRLDGLIALTGPMAVDLGRETVPSMVMEGIVDPSQFDSQPASVAGQHKALKTVLMYTGALGGLEEFLKALELVDDASLELWISGRGALEGTLREAAARDPRIVFLGFVSRSELRSKMSEASVFVLPRASQTPYFQYSFPSKLLEYMLAGRPVLSPPLPGIPEEYHPYLFLLHDETPEGWAAAIKLVCSLPEKELRDKGNAAREFVLREKNFIRQGQRMFAFMSQCVQRSRGTGGSEPGQSALGKNAW